MTGVFYDDDEVKAQQQVGERPKFEDVIHALWAKGNEHFSWRRECMMWDLPTLVGLYGTKHTLRTHYNSGVTCRSPSRRTTEARMRLRAPRPNARSTGTRPRRGRWTS